MNVYPFTVELTLHSAHYTAVLTHKLNFFLNAYCYTYRFGIVKKIKIIYCFFMLAII